MQSGSDEAPHSVSVMLVRQRYYPRVPPELLLREHAGKFHLSGLTLASLLDAVSPRVRPDLPPFVPRRDNNGAASDEFMYTLIRDNVRRPPVPRENIKGPAPSAQRFAKAVAEAKTRRSTNNVYSSSAALSSSATTGTELPSEDDAVIFKEAAPSYLTAVEFVRMTSRSGEEKIKREKGEKGGDKLQSRQGTLTREVEMDERESLWGYNTGAVLLVNLRSYAADLESRRHHQIFSPRARRSSMDHELDMDGDSSLGNSDGFSSSGDGQQDINPSEVGRYIQEHEVLQSRSEKAPRGVVLLGYHHVGGVCSLVYDCSNDLAISGGVDGTLFVWDVHQRYRGALRERYMNDEETRSMRPARQFATYIYTRRLTQRVSHAHKCAISCLATHCELLISGGVDGTVKVWSCLDLTGFSARGLLPQYVEQQVFTCNGWVRHIWTAPGRNVQGEDVFVTGENGFVIGFKGRTVSQQPLMQTSQTEKKLLNALRKSGTRVDCALSLGRKYSVDAGKSMRFPTITKSRLSSGNTGARLSRPASTEKEAIRLLQLGIITRALCTTRKLQTIGEEARLATLPARHSPVKDESTSAITRIIPLMERNLFVVLGYSPVVRFLDMTRLSMAAVVIHPSLTAAAGEGKSGDVQAAFSDNPHGVEKGRVKNTGGTFAQGKRRQMMGSTSGSGGTEALRFIDVLYVTSYDYLLLLDNRNTVYVWDNVENTFRASWKAPDTNENGKQKNALRLLPCGTHHYEGGGAVGRKRRSAQVQYRPRRRAVCFYEQMSDLENSPRVEVDASGVVTIPFFLLCSVGLELCGVVVEAQARLELKAHHDTIVGIVLREPPGFFLEQKHEKSAKRKSEDTDSVEMDDGSGAKMSTVSRTFVPSAFTGRITRCTESARGRNTAEEVDFGSLSEWLQESSKKSDDDARIRVLSCSADGVICFWGGSLEPLAVYDHRNVPEKNSNLCTTISHKPFQFDGVVSPFDLPPCTAAKRNSVAHNVEHGGCMDITSFYFNTHWNLAVTGHGDGSIRYWPCGKEVATCVWHKGLHRNAVSGLVGARIMEGDDQIKTLARLGSIVGALEAIEPNELLASVSFDGHLAVWECPHQAKANPRGRTRISFNELVCLAFDEINELFVVGDSAGTVSSWYAKDLGPRRSIPSRPPSPWRPSTTALAVSLVEEGLGTSSVDVDQHRHRSTACVTIISPDSTKHREKKRIGHTEAVTALLVDGNFVFSGGEDGRVFLWDLRIGVLLREYFLLHDVEDIAHHCRQAMSFSTISGSSMYSRENNPRSTGPVPFLPSTELKFYSENVTCMALLTRRNGNFLVATREGWVYHFEQSASYPRSTYNHHSSVRCMCVLQDGCADGDTGGDSEFADGNDLYSGGSRAFEVVVGDDEGKMALIRESYFFSTV